MTARRPLVLNAGDLEQVQDADQLDVGGWTLPASGGSVHQHLESDGAGNAQWVSDMEVPGDIIPYGVGHDLGGSMDRWNTVYCINASISGVLSITGYCMGSLASFVDGSYSLGASTKRWGAFYVLNGHIYSNSGKLYFGQGNIASIYSTGSGLYIDPKEVGSGNLTILGNIVLSGYDIITTGNITIDSDTSGLQLGASQDAFIYYDGTNLVVDPRQVGTGNISVNATTEITTDTGDPKGLYINGQTNEYTGTGFVYGVENRKTVNTVGSTVPGQLFASYNTLINKSYINSSGGSTAIINCGARNAVSASGNHSFTPLLGSLDETNYGLYNAASRGGTISVSGSPTIKTYGSYNHISDYASYDYAGSTLTKYQFGMCCFIAGGGTSANGSLVKTDYGCYIDMSQNGSGTKTGYGLFLLNGNGYDTYYGIWDTTAGAWVLDGDNKELIFGTDQDASLYYDGTDLIINPKEVGSGKLRVLGGCKIDEVLELKDQAADQTPTTNHVALYDKNGTLTVNDEDSIITSIKDVYGSMYVHNNPYTIVIATANTPVEIGGGWTTGSALQGTTFGGSHYLQVSYAGKYKIDWSLTLEIDYTHAFEAGIMIDGSARDEGTAETRSTGTGISYRGHLSGTTILGLTANQQISLYAMNITASSNTTMTHASLSAVRVGE